MTQYAVRTVQINKLGKERFAAEGLVLDEGWEPISAFFGNVEPWLVLRKKLDS